MAVLQEWLSSAGINYISDAPMKDYTSFKIGGKADILIKPASRDEIAAVVSKCAEIGMKYIIVGKGSNLLVSDSGIGYAVILIADNYSGVKLHPDNIIECRAGTSLAAVCAFARDHSLSGMEFAWGIPGTAGGAACMNAGAYGGEMKNVVVKCSHVDEAGNIGEFTEGDLDFIYRGSVYSGLNYCVTKVYIKLIPSQKDAIQAKMDDYMQRRRSKQPLDYPSAGSVFKRPEGNYAAALIEQCGLKGYTVGGAAVSSKHSGFIINTGGALSADVQKLIEHIKAVVKEKTGYELECEVKVVL
ncbi:MAG: UDP-N-acetylmuramate dehydrogenase [Oscillospiraceae bacterium]|nr:UDP-N-acetylmuramate dehydrogenase [Oscillospiraceae bacterium]